MLPVQAYAVPETTVAQKAFALSFLALVALIALGLRARMDKRGLSGRQEDHIEAVLGERAQTEPATTRFDPATVRDGAASVRQQVAETLNRADDNESGSQVTGLRHQLADAWRDLTSDVPDRARQLGEMALFVLLVAPFAVSADLLVAALSASPPSGDAATVAETAATLGQAAIETAAAFPYAGTVWALLLTVVLLGGQALFDLWPLVVIVLGAAAAAIYRFDDAASRRPAATRYRRATLTLGTLVLVWSLGVIPSTIGQAVGAKTIGDLSGILLAATVGVWAAKFGLQTLYRDLRYDQRGQPVDRRTVANRTAAASSSVLLLLAAPLALAYFAIAATSGNVARVADAYLAAHPLVQTVVAVSVLAIVVALAGLVRRHTTELGAALREIVTRSRVRGALFASGLPALGAVLVYIGLSGMTSLAVAAVAAIVAAAVYRWVAAKVAKLRYRAGRRERERRSDIFVELWTVTDADGNERHLGRVDGTELAHSDRDAFASACVRVVETVADGDDAPPLVAREYHDRLTDQGITDPDEIRAGVQERCRKEILQALRSGNGDSRVVSREWFDEETEGLPTEVRDEVLQSLRDAGTIYATSDVVELRTDPYRQAVDSRQGARRVTA